MIIVHFIMKHLIVINVHFIMKHFIVIGVHFITKHYIVIGVHFIVTSLHFARVTPAEAQTEKKKNIIVCPRDERLSA